MNLSNWKTTMFHKVFYPMIWELWSWKTRLFNFFEYSIFWILLSFFLYNNPYKIFYVSIFWKNSIDFFLCSIEYFISYSLSSISYENPPSNCFSLLCPKSISIYFSKCFCIFFNCVNIFPLYSWSSESML